MVWAVLKRPTLVVGGIGIVAAGLLWVRSEFAVNDRDRAELLLEQAQAALDVSEAQNAALAETLAAEVQAHYEARERAREISAQRVADAEAARRRYEAISDEIRAGLEGDDCADVRVPDAALDRLREYAGNTLPDDNR